MVTNLPNGGPDDKLYNNGIQVVTGYDIFKSTLVTNPSGTSSPTKSAEK